MSRDEPLTIGDVVDLLPEAFVEWKDWTRQFPDDVDREFYVDGAGDA